MNTRILTREYSVHFVAAVERCADEIATSDLAASVQTSALRWKISATTQSLHAATQMAPQIGLLDTWAFAVQMREFMSEAGAGGHLFGGHQDTVRALADDQATVAESLAKGLIPAPEFARYREFVARYVRDYPLTDLQFTRAPIVELWSRTGRANAKLVDSLGTIPEAMTDLADRLEVYGNTLPSQALWKTELALRTGGYSTAQVHSALGELNSRLDRMVAAADGAPELAHNTVGDVRRSALAIVDRLNEASTATIVALREERLALAAEVSSERLAAMEAVDAQRKAIALDAARIGNQVVTTTGREVRRTTLQILLLLILTAVVVSGLLFAAGYLLGRAHRGPGAPANLEPRAAG